MDKSIEKWLILDYFKSCTKFYNMWILWGLILILFSDKFKATDCNLDFYYYNNSAHDFSKVLILYSHFPSSLCDKFKVKY